MTGPRAYQDVAVAAPTSVRYERFSTKSGHYFCGTVLRQMLASANLDKAAVDGLCVSSFSLAPDTAVALTEHFGLATRWVDHLPFGGASGLIALHRAARAVEARDADIVACIAGDTNDPDAFRRSTASFSRFGRDAVYPYGSGGTNVTAAFLTDQYMQLYGATREDFGRICVAQRQNAAAYPNALLRKPLALEDYLAARPVADPLRLFDCVMPCSGAEGFLVMRGETAQAHGLEFASLVSLIERHNAFFADEVQTRSGLADGQATLFSAAGIGPDDIGVLEIYDDYPVIVAMQLEDLGFCQKGEAKALLRAHDFRVDGSLPLNTCGGQLSAGQAGAAGGFLGIVEAVRQLTGRALGDQVEDARTALVTGFGMLNFDRGLSSAAAILAAS
ncbi:MAG: thiolase family protein [Pseudomonadota bacterium]